jgi:hypothetical protein
MSDNLEALYDLIDELLTIDLVTDAELGMHVRKWYERETNPNSDDEDWNELMNEDIQWGDDDWE